MDVLINFHVMCLIYSSIAKLMSDDIFTEQELRSHKHFRQAAAEAAEHSTANHASHSVVCKTLPF